MSRRRRSALIAVALVLLGAAAPAQATSPGRNGRIFLSATVPGAQSGCGIASVHADGTGYSCLDPFGSDPAVSPDNRRIASTRGGDPADVFVAGIDGRRARRLTTAPGTYPSSLSPSFSPDSARILWFKYGGGAGGVYVMNADGSGQRRLTDAGQDPVFSPSGAQIAYTRGGIVIADAEGRGSRLIASDRNVTTRSPLSRYFETNAEPTWSPDERRLAFSRHTAATSFQCTPFPDCVEPVLADDVYAINADGSGLVRLTSTPDVLELDPSWSPDGRLIAYYRRPHDGDDSAGEVWVMNADGSGQRRLALGANPEWSTLQGGPARPRLKFRFRRRNERRRCLGRYDGWSAIVKTSAPRLTGYRISMFLNGRLYDQIANARGLGGGPDARVRRGRTYRLRVLVEGTAVNDRLSRSYRFRRC